MSWHDCNKLLFVLLSFFLHFVPVATPSLLVLRSHVVPSTSSYGDNSYSLILFVLLFNVFLFCHRVVECTDLYGCNGNGTFSDPYVSVSIQGPLSRCLLKLKAPVDKGRKSLFLTDLCISWVKMDPACPSYYD